jgi:two-component system NtrC family sensor kinase
MKLSTRLLLPLLSTVMIVMAVYGARSLAQREEALGERARLETEAYATALGMAFEYAFRDRKLTDVQDIINRAAIQRQYYDVIVYDSLGKVLFSSDSTKAKQAAAREVVRDIFRTGTAASFERTLDGRRVYSVLRPIRSPRRKVVGAFEVAEPLSFIEAQKAESRQRFLVYTGLLLAALTIMILFLVRNLIARPLRQFVEAVRAFGRGELGHRVSEKHGGGELDVLAREFNNMADRLEGARTKLVRETEERISLERRFRETEKLAALGNLAAGLGHEIAAPLHVVAGRAEMLLKKDLEADQRERHLRIIVEQIGRITTIIRDLLDFARRREVRSRPTDLALVVDGAIQLVESELTRNEVELERDIPPNLWVHGDPHLLHQVFVNLVMNSAQALRAVDHKRRISIRVLPTAENGNNGAAPTGHVALEVEDSGPGIPADILPHVFEPFFTTKTAGEGTGLGLAVARSILEEHGGTLEVQNRPGGGAVFRMTIPDVPAPEPAHA